MTFAERLRELRTEKKMSLNDIASYVMMISDIVVKINTYFTKN